MAAGHLSLEEELFCSECFDIFKDPVLLSCGHSFCRICLQLYWEEKSSWECPICNTKSSVQNPPVNRALKNIVEAFLQKAKSRVHSEDLCSLHGEKLQLFCEEDQEAVCVVCQAARKHRNHHLCPVGEAAQDMKEKLKAELNPIKEKQGRFIKVKQECEKTAEHIRSQAQHTESQIKAEFEKLHQFLRDEEKARLAALREEEELKSMIVREKIENITRHVSTLSDKITAIEKVLDSEDLSFLKTYKNINEKVQRTLHHSQTFVREFTAGVNIFGIRAMLHTMLCSSLREDMECEILDSLLGSRALIDVAKHLGNLKFRVWEKMLGMMQYAPVTLDPNTVSPWLCLSDDLTSVRHTGVKQKLPDHPERFDCSVSVLGSEGFTSGKHSWEVDVGNKPEWTVGVVKESISRKGSITYSPKGGFWVLMLRNGDEYKACTSPPTHLTLKRKPQRIRVQLDYDRGEVSFYDPSDMSLIYIFNDTFTERIFPYFSPGLNTDGSNPGALQICPVKVSVTEGDQ